jgi:hypothetical protein
MLVSEFGLSILHQSEDCDAGVSALPVRGVYWNSQLTSILEYYTSTRVLLKPITTSNSSTRVHVYYTISQ